ncbi:MAG: PrsW family glutamic-type intramembrane protease [bacterium]|nr:PrsW family glutamic-type intramembrane protease [bacterium]
MSASTLFFALTGGILPALLWLWFWLQEDRLHPEPRGMIIRTFVAGMVAVPLVLPLEQLIQKHYSFNLMLVIILWASAEEIFKWAAAGLAAFDTKEYDEPIDAVVYMLTAALGFAAMENVFFLVTSISNTNVVESLVTGNLRFIGATLLHVLSSGVIGLFMGLSFCKGWFTRKISLVFGIAAAILLHTLFNIYIMKSGGTSIFIIFCFVWVAVLLLIAGFQKVKNIRECKLR